ncbi:MAG TPA: hypothetical protein PLG17_10530, partial [Thermodesulfobacteriota bacterium]|nr:hypothetical protein [Thermodesulfobacteriota bacterium]
MLRNTPSEIRSIIPSEQWKTQPVAASPIIRMAGAFIDFDKLVSIGIPGLRKEIAAAKSVFGNDVAEIFIDPGDTGNYIHIAVNAAGMLYFSGRQ